MEVSLVSSRLVVCYYICQMLFILTCLVGKVVLLLISICPIQISHANLTKLRLRKVQAIFCGGSLFRFFSRIRFFSFFQLHCGT